MSNTKRTRLGTLILPLSHDLPSVSCEKWFVVNTNFAVLGLCNYSSSDSLLELSLFLGQFSTYLTR